MTETVNIEEDINDFYLRCLIKLAAGAENSLNIEERHPVTMMMRAFEQLIKLPLKSKEIEDKEVYKQLRKLMDETRHLMTYSEKEWDETIHEIVAMLMDEVVKETH